MVLVSTHCQSGISTSVSESESTASSPVRLQMTSKAATIQYKPVRVLLATSLHITNSRVALIKYYMYYLIFMACTGAAEIFLTSYLYTV